MVDLKKRLQAIVRSANMHPCGCVSAGEQSRLPDTAENVACVLLLLKLHACVLFYRCHAKAQVQQPNGNALQAIANLMASCDIDQSS